MKYIYAFLLYCAGVYFLPISMISFVLWDNWLLVSFEYWNEILRLIYMIWFLILTAAFFATNYDLYKKG